VRFDLVLQAGIEPEQGAGHQVGDLPAGRDSKTSVEGLHEQNFGR
jgi:hypothetical protein